MKLPVSNATDHPDVNDASWFTGRLTKGPFRHGCKVHVLDQSKSLRTVKLPARARARPRHPLGARAGGSRRRQTPEVPHGLAVESPDPMPVLPGTSFSAICKAEEA